MRKLRLASPALFLLLFAAAPAAAQPNLRFPDQLTLFAIPAPLPVELSWKSPGGLVRRVLVNEAGAMLGFFTRTLGHMGVHVQCAAAGALPAEEFKGSMTNVDSHEFTDTAV